MLGKSSSELSPRPSLCCFFKSSGSHYTDWPCTRSVAQAVLMFWFSCLGLLSSLAHTKAPPGQVQQDILSLVLIALKGGRWTKMQSLALQSLQIIGISSSARMLLRMTPRSSHNYLGTVKVLFTVLSRLSLQPSTPSTLLLKVPPLTLPFPNSKILTCPAHHSIEDMSHCVVH